MKILVVSTTAFAINEITRYGGTERLAWDFARGFQQRGDSVSLLAASDTIPPDNVELISAGYPADPNLGREADAYVNNRTRIRDFDITFDLTHQHYFPRNEGISLPCASVFWHDPYLGKFLQSSYNVVALSPLAADRFEEVYHQEALFQETILVDKDKYGYSSEKDRKERFIFIGKMSKEKGALKAIEYAIKSGVQLRIIGGKGIPSDSDEYQKEVRAAAQKYKGQIFYLGEVSDEVKIKELQTAKALIYPVGQLEVSSMKSIEALMTGCPVITYDYGAMSHVVTHELTGYLAKDDDEFLEAMRAIGGISSAACRIEARARWASDIVIEDYSQLFEKIIEGYTWF